MGILGGNIGGIVVGDFDRRGLPVVEIMGGQFVDFGVRGFGRRPAIPGNDRLGDGARPIHGQ